MMTRMHSNKPNMLDGVIKGRIKTDEGAYVKDASITDVKVEDGRVTLRLDSEAHLSFWMEINLDKQKLLHLLQQ